MKRTFTYFLTLIIAVTLLFITQLSFAQDNFYLGNGSDGALTVANGIIAKPSTCTRATANLPVGQTFVPVASTTGFGVGDLIMILQTSGLTGQTSGSQTSITVSGGVGLFELKRVTALTGTRLTFTGGGLTNAYTVANTQVVLVSEYTNVTVQPGGMIIPTPFDGLSGGVIAFLATGTVTINGTVGLAGQGAAGATYEQGNVDTYYGINTTTSATGGKKGYGIALLAANTGYAYGNQANGGGGGNANSGGGGGGANAGKGGKGGLTSGNAENADFGGRGGAALSYSPISRLVFGGSGGAGHGDDPVNSVSGNGGSGGGIIFIRANAVAGSGYLNANGSTAATSVISAGAGGGGGGGTIYLRTAGTIAPSLNITANGGNGGNNNTIGVAPGGGGGGGRIYIQGTSYTGTPQANPGLSGLDGNGQTSGATGGETGEITINTTGLVNPTLPVVTSPVLNSTVNTPKPVISGTATANSTVSIYIDNTLDGTATTNSSGNFSYTPSADLSNSAHSITADAELLGLKTSKTTAHNFTVAVTPVAPTNIQLSATAINENVAAGSVVGTLSSTDANTGDTFTYSLVSGTGDTDNGAFTITGNELKINASPDYEIKNSYSILVRTTDQSGLFFDKNFTITINNVIETPTTITLTPATFPENIASGTIVATLNADGDFNATRSFFFTLGGTGSDDNNLFGITDEGNGVFKIKWGGTEPPDFESIHGATYKIRLIFMNDQFGTVTIERPLTLTLTNVNEAPTDLTLSANTVNENVAADTTIGTLTTTDPDSGDSFTYSLVGGAGSTDNAAFTITGNTLKIVASPDFETKSSYSIRVRTTDGGALTLEKIFTISINDIAEPQLTVGGTLTNFVATQGNPSVSQSFTVSGTALNEGILITPPTGFEVSTNNASFTPTVTVGSAGTVSVTTIYLRLSPAAGIGSYAGDIFISSTGAQARQFGISGTVTAGRRFVTVTGAGTKDGSSWANASDDLRTILGSSAPGAEIWVAKGTYKPTLTTNRALFFSVANGTSVYGGFAGNETSLAQRNLTLNPTILSGDIGVAGSNTDNSYRVVVLSSLSLPTTVDGFTITDGSSIGLTSGTNTSGAGIYIFDVRNLLLKNLIITKNTSRNEGGGVNLGFNTSGTNTVTFSQVSFIQNKALDYGGGGICIAGNQAATISLDRCIFDGNQVTRADGLLGTGGALQISSTNASAAATLTNCLFINNNSTGKNDDGGGAIMNYGGTININNSTLYNNTTGSTAFPDGNTVSNVSPGITNIVNSIIWGSAAKHISKPSGTVNLSNSLIKGETVTAPNLNSDPLFFNTASLAGVDGILGTADDGLNIRYSSPAKNTGTASNAPATDLAGTARPQGGAIDMGAYQTTAAQPVITAGTLTGLSAGYGAAPVAGSFTVSGTGMDAGILVTAPANFEVSLSSLSGFADAVTAGSADNISAIVYVRLKSSLAAGTYSGNIVLTSLSASTVNVAASCVVAKAALTITANNVSKTYMQALTNLTGSTDFTASGLQNNETIGTVSIAYGNGAAANAAVGTYTGTVTPSDATGGSFNPANYNITYAAGNIIIAAPSIVLSPATLPAGTISTAYNKAITATGGISSYTFSIVGGALPAGMNLAGGGTVSGTPTASGTFSFTVMATDASTGAGAPYTGTKAYSLTITAPVISLSPSGFTNGTVGVAYNGAVTATGGTANYTYTLTAGALPTGLTLAANGTFSGTPKAGGTFNFTITATDSSTGDGPHTGSKAYVLTIDPPIIAVAPAILSGGSVGTAYSQTLTATGGTADYAFTVATGTLPAGLTLGSDGTLSGTPTAGGTFIFSIKAIDASTGAGAPYSGSRAYILVIAPPTLALSPGTLPGGTVGTAYSQTIIASGGTASYTYRVASGSLPAGLSLATNGVLDGTPTASGTYNFTIEATDSSTGTGPYAGSKAYALIIAAGSQTITFNPIAAQTYGAAPITLSGSSSSGLLLTYSSSNTNVATISNNMLTIVGAGTSEITASQSGNSNFGAATAVTQTLQVNKTTANLVLSNLTHVYDGTPQAATVTTTPAALSGVAITYNGSSTAPSAAGTYTVTATLDHPNYTAPNATGNLIIGKAEQSITFSSLANKTYGDAAFDLTATGGASGNDVTYSSSNTAVATISGNKVTIVGAGTTKITASQAGNGNYNAAADVEQTLTVGKASQSITFTALANKTYGDAAFDLTATGGASGNAVTYTSSNTGVATISGNKVTIVGAGTTKITASQAGNGNYDAAADVEQILTVGKASQLITFNTLTDKTYGDAAFDLTATGGASGNNVTYSSSNTAVATISGSRVTIVGAGTTKITASQAGNDNYNAAADVEQTLTVGKTSQSITFNSLANKTYGDAAFDLTATGGASGNAVTYTSSNTGVATINGNKVTIVGAGTTKITASQAGNGNYNTAADVEQILTVGKASQAITFAAIDNKTYGDAAFTLTATTGVAGNPITYSSSNPAIATVSGNTVTITGAGNVTITASQQGNANYTAAASISQRFSIAPKPVTAAFSVAAKVYDGDLMASITGRSINGVLAADLAEVTLTGGTAVFDKKDAGSNKVVTVTNFELAGSRKANYVLTSGYSSSTGTITPKELTITADNLQKLQGLPLPGFTASYSGFVTGETSAVLSSQPVFSTTATANSPEGSYPIVVSGAAAQNYSMKYVNGTLTVKPGYPSNITFTAQTLLENAATGTLAGTFASTSADPNASFTYSLVSGTGDADNNQFTISGNQLRTAASLNYEAKAVYSVRVRSTTQYGLTLDQSFNINLTDVNEAPTLDAIVNQAVCAVPAQQLVNLSGITAGPEANQTVTLTVNSGNAALFSNLSVSAVTGGNAQLRYTPAAGARGTVTVTVTVKDNGGTANGGTDSFSRSFILTLNALPVPVIVSSAGTSISKGATVVLTAGGGVAYQWRNAPGIIGTGSAAALTVRPAETTTYSVTVTNASGCQETKEFTLTVNADYELISGTNILSPNGDGKNDRLVIRNLDLYPNNEVKIFDRAGRLLYAKRNYQNEWDGTFNGLPLAEGTYYYIVDFGPGITRKKGFVSIIRD